MTAQTVPYKAKAFDLRNLAFFFLIVYGLQVLKYGLLYTGVIKIPSGEGLAALSAGPGILLITLASWGPLIAAFLVTAVSAGRDGIKALWGRFWNRNLSLKWLLVTLLLLPALALISNLISRAVNGVEYPVFNLPDPAWTVILTFLSAFVFNGMLEEFGWRGFVLPRFQARWNALISSLILGILWAAWHFGQWLIPAIGRSESIGGFTLRIVLEAVMITWIFNNTKGSVLAACLYHAMVNTLPIGIGSIWIFYGVQIFAVALIGVVFGPKSLNRQVSGNNPAAEKSLVSQGGGYVGHSGG
jgi:membrane protease YdiL (CAAX protease family)